MASCIPCGCGKVLESSGVICKIWGAPRHRGLWGSEMGQNIEDFDRFPTKFLEV